MPLRSIAVVLLSLLSVGQAVLTGPNRGGASAPAIPSPVTNCAGAPGCTLNVTAGDTIYVAMYSGGNPCHPNVGGSNQDSLGNTYTQRQFAASPVDLSSWTAVAGSSGSDTITAQTTPCLTTVIDVHGVSGYDNGGAGGCGGCTPVTGATTTAFSNDILFATQAFDAAGCSGSMNAPVGTGASSGLTFIHAGGTGLGPFNGKLSDTWYVIVPSALAVTWQYTWSGCGFIHTIMGDALHP